MKAINKLFFLAVILCFGYTGHVSAEPADYQFEAAADYTKLQESKTYQFDLIYYFNPITPKDKPLAEASFFSRSPAVLVSLFTKKNQSAFNFDTQGAELGYKYAGNDVPYTYSIGYKYSTGDITDATTVLWDEENDTYIYIVGYFILPTIYATLGYRKTDTHYNSRSFLTASSTTSNRTWLASIKYVHTNMDATAFNIIAAYATIDYRDPDRDDKYYSLAATYYINQHFGFGGEYQVLNSELAFAEGNLYGVNLSYFFTPQFYLAGTYRKFKNDLTAADDFSYTNLSANLRF